MQPLAGMSAIGPKRTWTFVIVAPFRALAVIGNITYRNLGATNEAARTSKVAPDDEPAGAYRGCLMTIAASWGNSQIFVGYGGHS